MMVLWALLASLPLAAQSRSLDPTPDSRQLAPAGDGDRGPAIREAPATGEIAAPSQPGVAPVAPQPVENNAAALAAGGDAASRPSAADRLRRARAPPLPADN